MPGEPEDTAHLEAPLRQLERSLIDEYVCARGHDPLKLTEMPEQERIAMLTDASVYASAKLAEVESRAHYVNEMHDGKTGTE